MREVKPQEEGRTMVEDRIPLTGTNDLGRLWLRQPGRDTGLWRGWASVIRRERWDGQIGSERRLKGTEDMILRDKGRGLRTKALSTAGSPMVAPLDESIPMSRSHTPQTNLNITFAGIISLLKAPRMISAQLARQEQ